MADEPAVPSPQTNDGMAYPRLTDALTGLTSRYALDYFLTGREDEPVGLILADADGFMAVNDTYGHLVGDQVLIRIARRITVAMPLDCIASRFGGDEFELILPDTDDITKVQDVAMAILRSCDTPIEVDAIAVDLRMSIGIAIAPPGDILAGLIAVDAAMMAAKQRGRARAVCLDPEWEIS